MQAIALAPTTTKWIVVAAKPVTDIDITAAEMLAELDKTLHQADMDLCFAEMKGPVKDILKRFGLLGGATQSKPSVTLDGSIERKATKELSRNNFPISANTSPTRKF